MSKKVIGGFIILIAAIAAVITLGSCKSCENKFPWQQDKDKIEATVDSLVELNAAEIADPTFYDVTDVIVYRNTVNDAEFVDSVFYSLENETIANVAGVLIKKNGYAKKKCIVDEYLRNNDVYNNLPTNPTTTPQSNDSSPIAEISLEKEGKTTVTEAPPTGVSNGSVSHITVKDTTIDGVRTTITTKVEKHE